MKIEFEEATHTYKVESVKVPSVTEIIAETTGTAWKAAPWYMDRGKAIHACAAFIAQGKEFKYDERLAGYVKALRKFFNEVQPEVRANELAVASMIYQYAGMLDLYCKIGIRNIVIDYKHSVDRERIKLQVAGYSIALKETLGIDCNFGAGVQIKDSGDYSMTEVFSLSIPSREFLALRTCYKIKERCKELSFQKKLDN